MSSEKFCFCGLWFAILCCIPFAGGASLRCYKGTLDEYTVTPLNKPLPPPFITCLDYTIPTIIYTFGYRGRSSGPATTAVLSAYIKKKKSNVILLDWEEEAMSGVLGIPLGYTFYAVPNAKKIGREMGEALINMHQAGFNVTHTVHLIGHSLGAHIMGYAGRRFREDGLAVARITGLDPARALFEGTFALQTGLDSTCAKFVDVIHTDPGGYGTSTSHGTVDIWPNYGTVGTTQPGCPTGDFDMFSPEDLCSHDRSWRYYVEAVLRPTAFQAGYAPDYDRWVANAGKTKQKIYLGDLTNTRAHGNFYLTTNSDPYYGRFAEALIPDKSQVLLHGNNTSTKLLTYLR